MNLIWQGFVLGIGLSILVGPMMFIFLQIGIERGFRAGLAAGLGVWISDFSYIVAVYFGISYIRQIIAWDGFEFWLGSIGGIIIMIIGLTTLLSRAPQKSQQGKIDTTNNSYFSLFTKGFVVNTFNPFPLIFWSGVMTSFSAKYSGAGAAALLFGSILLTVIFTDMLKILLAKRLQKILTDRNVYYLRRGSGIILLVLGLGLFIRSWL